MAGETFCHGVPVLAERRRVEFGGPAYKELNFRNVTNVTDFPLAAP
jgi:hypothetical protein